MEESSYHGQTDTVTRLEVKVVIPHRRTLW